MNPSRRQLFPLLLTLLSPLAWSDGNYLLDRCQAAQRFAESGRPQLKSDMAYCYGLLQGIRELNALYERKDPTQAFFCTGERYVKHSESAKLVVEYLQTHDDQLHRNESVLAVQAFRQAFPCG